MCMFMLLCVLKKKKKRPGRIYTKLLTIKISEECKGVRMTEKKNRRDTKKSLYIDLDPFFGFVFFLFQQCFKFN